MSHLLDIHPADLGLPRKFSSFRPAQADAIEFLLDSSRQFAAANAPPGVGKSLLGVACAQISGRKAVYLTSTKALQEQIHGDFKTVGMKDIRGRANYSCRVYSTQTGKNVSCDEGREEGCHLKETTGCPYFNAYEQAKCSSLISTNYSYWLHARRSSPTALSVDETEPVELLICDEAHNAIEELARFLAVHLPKAEYADSPIERMTGSGLMSESTGQRWREWAALKYREVNRLLGELKRKYGTIAEAKKQEGEKYAELENSKTKYTAILSMSDNWCWECDERGVSFDPIWPGRYSHLLWSGVSRVVLLSATLWPYTLHLLGLSRDDYEFREFSNGWPPNKGLVYYLPTAKLNYRSTDEDYARVVERMDDIIDARRDRKGIIHTVSYSRMRRLLSHSRNGRIMHTNDSSSDSFLVAERYRKAQPPAVLLSPSYGTGWDFPYEQCEYQIIPKIPFTYAESRVMQERCKDDNYRTYMAMMELTQMIGRGRRAHDDRCETFILDSNLPLLMHRGRSFCAKGFAIHKIISLPAKPEKIIPRKSCIGESRTGTVIPVTATG